LILRLSESTIAHEPAEFYLPLPRREGTQGRVEPTEPSSSGVHPLRETGLLSIKVDISREEMSYGCIPQAIHSRIQASGSPGV